MSELISKRRLEEALICGLCRSEKTDDYKNGLWDALRIAEAIEPVNAVELPCKVGDTVYSPTTTSVEAAIVDHIRLTQDGIYLNLREWHCLSNINRIGKSMFLTREEAEKALEDLENG